MHEDALEESGDVALAILKHGLGSRNYLLRPLRLARLLHGRKGSKREHEHAHE